MTGACDEHMRRPRLLRELGANLNRRRDRLDELLALADPELVAAIGGTRRRALATEVGRWGARQAAAARAEAKELGLAVICRCDRRYPTRLSEAASAPAVLHVCGDPGRFAELCEGEMVAVVGCRGPSPYGLAMARELGRALAMTGITVVSGMADGIDAEAHAGALAVSGSPPVPAGSTPAAAGATLAVLGGSAHRPYPAGRARLHGQIVDAGAVVSEVPPGTATRPWTFVARNRIIAGLASMTVVVEAGRRSGALITAAASEALGRPVGAVPGQVTMRTAEGALALLADGAMLVRGPQDVLDRLYGVGVRRAPVDRRPTPTPAQERILRAVAVGHDTVGALGRAGLGASGSDGGGTLVELAALELSGWLRRGPGGRFAVVP